MTTENVWYRDGAAAMQFETFVVRFLLGPWIPDVIRAAGPGPGERVLDLACGTGAVARAVAAAVGPSVAVTGLDVNPEMLAVAREVATETEIQWELGDASDLPFRDASFDVVLCHQGLQFVSDRTAALREIRRVLSPGGRVALAVWSRLDRNPYCLALIPAMARHVGDEAGEMLRCAFALGDGAELRALLTEMGFEGVVVRPVGKTLRLPPLDELIPGHLAGTSLASAAAAMDPQTRAAVIGDVTSELRPDPGGQGLALPFEIQLAAAQRAT